MRSLPPTDGPSASRRRFLELAGGTGAISILLAACGEKEETIPAGDGRDTAPGPGEGDAAILNFALTLEYLEADFYRRAVDSGELRDRRVAEVVKAIGADEREHVGALKAALAGVGARPVTAPRTRFDEILGGGQGRILETAATVENLGAAAYLGQAGRIQDAGLLATALSIHSNEGRHAAALNRLVGGPIVPDGAFAKPATMDEVRAGLRPFIVA